MTSIKSAHKRKQGFRLPAFNMRLRPQATRGTVLAITQASPNRIIDATPTLKALYQFLARPIP